VHNLNERKWTDNKANKANMIQGKFTPDEIKCLLHAFCEYARLSGIGPNGVVEMCSKPSKEISDDSKKAWCKVAECLPTRSVQSIHNFCRRRFNPDNYSGKWTSQEQQSLLDLCTTLGNQWKTIARVLNDQYGGEARTRTAENVKDKYKQLGAENAATRQVGEWALEEVLTLLRSVEKATKVQILCPSVEIKLRIKDSEANCDVPETRKKVSGSCVKVFSKTVRFEEILPHVVYDLNKVKSKLVEQSISQISWAAISEKMKTRSSDDIRQYWNLKLLPLFIPDQHKWT